MSAEGEDSRPKAGSPATADTTAAATMTLSPLPPQVLEAVEAARSAGVPVFWVIRSHDPSGNDIERTRRHLFDPPGCGTGATVTGTEGAELAVPLAANPGEPIVLKRRFSAFFATTLDMLLRRGGCRHVVLCGVQTPNCIRAAAVDAISLDYERVDVLADATASATEEIQKANLRDLAAMGVGIVSTDDWRADLGRGI